MGLATRQDSHQDSRLLETKNVDSIYIIFFKTANSNGADPTRSMDAQAVLYLCYLHTTRQEGTGCHNLFHAQLT